MDSVTLELLKLIDLRSSIALSDIAAIANCDPLDIVDPIQWLIKRRYIRISTPFQDDDIEANLYFDSPLAITQDGRIILAQTEKEIKRYKYVETRAWITLSIAIIALLVSIVAVVLGA